MKPSRCGHQSVVRPLRSGLVIIATAALAASGCGDSGDAAATAQRDDPTPLLHAAARGLAKAGSYHVEATATDEGDDVHMEGDLFASGDGRLAITYGSGTKLATVVAGRDSYFKAPAAWWHANVKELPMKIAKRIGDRWIHLDRSAVKSMRSDMRDLRPAEISKCLIGTTGTLTRLPDATVGGTRVIVLKDLGDRPGSAVGRYFISAGEPTLPVRVVQMGERHVGGRGGSCSGGLAGDDPVDATFTFSRIGHAARATAPPGAVSIEEAAGVEGGGGVGAEGRTDT
jgi:hypothetical protein